MCCRTSVGDTRVRVVMRRSGREFRTASMDIQSSRELGKDVRMDVRVDVRMDVRPIYVETAARSWRCMDVRDGRAGWTCRMDVRMDFARNMCTYIAMYGCVDGRAGVQTTM